MCTDPNVGPPAKDTRVLSASPDYLDRRGTPLHPDDLAEHRLIAFGEPVPKKLRDRDGETFRFDPRDGECRLIMDDGLSQKLATIAGAGISINSLWSVHHELLDHSLVRVLPTDEVDDQSVLWLVYPKSNVLTEKVRVFIDYLIERIGATPPRCSR